MKFQLDCRYVCIIHSVCWPSKSAQIPNKQENVTFNHENRVMNRDIFLPMFWCGKKKHNNKYKAKMIILENGDENKNDKGDAGLKSDREEHFS